MAKNGIGFMLLRTTGRASGAKAAQLGFEIRAVSVGFTVENSIQNTTRFVNGTLRSSRRVVGEVTEGLTMAFNDIDWIHRGLAVNQTERVLPSVAIPKVTTITVPDSAPHRVVDPYFTTANSNLHGFTPFIPDDGSWGRARPLIHTASAPQDGQFQVDNVNTALVFNAAQAGATVVYPKFATYTEVPYYGGAGTADELGSFEMWVQVYDAGIPEGVMRYYPRCSLLGDAASSKTASIEDQEMEVNVELPGGWNRPYLELKLPTTF